jgi:hypothetical protein
MDKEKGISYGLINARCSDMLYIRYSDGLVDVWEYHGSRSVASLYIVTLILDLPSCSCGAEHEGLSLLST